MRKLVLALAVGMLVAASASAVAPQSAKAAAVQAKVVIVVGATQGTTASYRSDADAAAAVFAKYTSNITKVYSPNATWAAVSAAAQGANILVYLGHGSGYPNPYVGYLQPNGDNGMGLNAAAVNSDSNTQYYGENYMAQLALAPNAVVLLNHLCYASGDSEWGKGLPSLSVAQQRVDGYASGFLRGGARAVIADGLNDLSSYIDGMFTSHSTIDAVWKSADDFHNHLSSWASTRSAGYTSQIDPDLDHPASDGDVYYRSMVSIPSLATDSVVSGATPPYVSQSGTYHPVTPARVVDTRGLGIGPAGKLASGGAYTYQISGKGGVPSGAIAVTANITVTGQLYGGWVFVGPTIWTKPGSSTVNFPVSDDRANGVTVPLSASGSLDAWYDGTVGATTNLIIDVTGYYLGTDGDGYTQYGPHRILDTRDGTGLRGQFVSSTPRTINVAGVSGIPSTGVVAIAGNVTVVSPSYRGYVFVGPTATSTPSSSTINFPAGDIRANNFIVPVNSDGTISAVYISSVTGRLDLVIDIFGYFTAGSGAQFHTLNPTRILDSRSGTGLTGPIPSSTPETLQIVGAGGVPSGAAAISANLTVTGQSYAGWAAIGPSISTATPFSNLNFPVGDNRANGVIVPLTDDGSAQLAYGASPGQQAQLILDVNGYFK